KIPYGPESPIPNFGQNCLRIQMQVVALRTRNFLEGIRCWEWELYAVQSILDCTVEQIVSVRCEDNHGLARVKLVETVEEHIVLSDVPALPLRPVPSRKH